MGTCIRCQGEYDDRTKICMRCDTLNYQYAKQVAQGMSIHLPTRVLVGILPLVILLAAWIMIVIVGYPVSARMVLVLSVIGLVIWFLVTLTMLYLSSSARFTFWKNEHLRDLDFLAKKPLRISLVVTGALITSVLLIVILGLIFVFYILSPHTPGREYTAITIILALFFSLALEVFFYALIIAVQVGQLMALLPPPIFTDSQTLQDLVVESTRESLDLSKKETSVAEVKRTDKAGIDLVLLRTTKQTVTDERGGRKEETRAQPFQVKADRWGRVTSIEEKKKD